LAVACNIATEEQKVGDYFAEASLSFTVVQTAKAVIFTAGPFADWTEMLSLFRIAIQVF